MASFSPSASSATLFPDTGSGGQEQTKSPKQSTKGIGSTSDQLENLSSKLNAVGLGEYSARLIEHGFEDWTTVLDMTEEDMSILGIKIGHRRVLQREITKSRSLSSFQESSRTSFSPGSRSTPPTPTTEVFKRPKRRYRRHPQADVHAPKRPKTAYVNFSDHLRSLPEISNMSFVDIAREVGRQWQQLPAEHRKRWEEEASEALKAYEAQLEAYRRSPKYHEYQLYLATFKTAPSKTPRPTILVQHFSTSSNESNNSCNRSESCDSESSPSYLVSPLDTQDELLRQDCQQSLNKATSDLRHFKMRYNNISTYNTRRVPDEALIRPAVSLLLKATDALLFQMTTVQMEIMLDHIYKRNLPPDTLTLAEACIIGACGAHYLPMPVPKRTIHELFASACVLLDTVPVCDATYLRIARIFLFFTFYSILEKSLSARSFIKAGLATMRFRLPILQNSSSVTSFQKTDWQKVYRSLLFFEAWLSYTLGWNLSQEHFRAHCQLALVPVTGDTSQSNTIQFNAAHLAVIASKISTAIRQPALLTSKHIRHLANELDAWKSQLPTAINLETIRSGQGATPLGPFGERCCVMMHILYLGAVILLYHRVLVNRENEYSEEALGITSDEVAQYKMDCQLAAECIPKLLDKLQFGGAFPPKCWVTIYWSFMAGAILLYQTAHFSSRNNTQQTQALLESSAYCLNTLRSCSQTEPVAVHFLNLVEQSYNTLVSIDARRRRKMDIRSLLSEEPTTTTASPSVAQTLDVIQNYIAGLLKDPYGRAHARKGLSAELLTERDDSDILFWFT